MGKPSLHARRLLRLCSPRVLFSGAISFLMAASVQCAKHSILTAVGSYVAIIGPSKAFVFNDTPS